MLGIDAAFDGMALDDDVLLLDRERQARSDPDLLVDEVDPGDHLGDRMLDLDSGVHLDEIELAILVEELDRAGADDTAAWPSRPRRSRRSGRARRR
jgi:hypothetical protein